MKWTVEIACHSESRELLSTFEWANTIPGGQMPVPAGTAYVSVEQITVDDLPDDDQPWQLASDGHYWPAGFLPSEPYREALTP